MTTVESCRIELPLFARSREIPDKTAVIDGRLSWSYGALATLVAATSARLQAAGLRAGDRAVIFLDKHVEAVVALYAVWAAGGIAVPAYEGLRSRQVRHIVEDSGARLLISTARKLASLESGSAGEAAPFVLDRRTLRGWRVPEGGAPRRLAGGTEPAAILYTSGSTGAPKGILVSHANLCAGARIVARYLGLRRDERVLSVLPFGFDYGLNQLLTTVRTGATLHLQRSHFPPDICRTLADQRITLLAAVPPLWAQLMDRFSPFSRTAFPHLRTLTNSGGVFPAALVRRYRAQLPQARLFLMYGLSEAFRSTFLPPELVDSRTGSIGRAIPETEVLVVARGADGSVRLCADDEPGELVHSGPTVALGYWRQPEATAQRFRPHPFAPESGAVAVYSGDIVRRDRDGFLYFIGRSDQQIKSQGYRVSPEDVEQILHDSGMVSAALVCGRPDETAGTVLVAHVVPNERFSEQALLAFCHREMPTYMVPRAVRVHQSLPCTPSGKLDRNAVIDDAPPADQAGSLYRKPAAA